MNKIYVKPNTNGAKSQSGKAMEKLQALLQSPLVNESGKTRIQVLLENLEQLKQLFADGFADPSEYSPPSLSREWRILR
ncbi:MAG: hypothetical protein AAF518_08805 [Spirochaetota bacterium]